MHEAEEQLAAFLDMEQVRVLLEDARAQVAGMAGPEAEALARQIQAELARAEVPLSDAATGLLAELADFLQVPLSQLLPSLPAMIAAAGPAAAAGCQAMAQRLADALQPQAGSLATRVTALLASPPADLAPRLKLLLQEADTVVLPGAAAVQASLSNALAAAAAALAAPAPVVGPAPAPAPSLADWQAVLNQAQLFLAGAERYATRLAGAMPTPQPPRWRALLATAQNLIYNRRDTDLATLLSWHNKTSWLTACGLFLILALSAALGNEVLFLLGATGGLLSRLSRSLYRQDVPTDYGASWTTLFLSPVVGALGGWVGVLIVSLAYKLQLLGPLFESIRWDSPYNALAYGVAFFFGFSERAFNNILSQMENKVLSQNQQAAGAAASGPAITTPAALPSAPVGRPYSVALAGTGGKAPFTWAVSAGALPAGLTLVPAADGSAAATLSGTPAAPVGGCRFTVSLKDAAGGTDTRVFTIS